MSPHLRPLSQSDSYVGIVCLRNGTMKLGDIAATLGYANHSPISKALSNIRKKAAEFLNLNLS